MRSYNACIASTPAYFTDMPTAGLVEVRPLLSVPEVTDWTLGYFNTYGAIYVPWRAWRRDDAVIALLSHILELLIFDGIHPAGLHRQFLKIDEYRQLFGYAGRDFAAKQFARLDYFQTYGTSEIGWGTPANKALIAIMIYAVQLLVIDDVTSVEVHSEFMKVDQYGERFGSHGRPFAPKDFPSLRVS